MGIAAGESLADELGLVTSSESSSDEDAVRAKVLVPPGESAAINDDIDEGGDAESSSSNTSRSCGDRSGFSSSSSVADGGAGGGAERSAVASGGDSPTRERRSPTDAPQIFVVPPNDELLEERTERGQRAAKLERSLQAAEATEERARSDCEKTTMALNAERTQTELTAK